VKLKLLTYNIKEGGRGREPHIVRAINGCAPDLVLLQEATQPAAIERIAAATGMAQWAARSGHSLGFMSRRPVEHYAWHRPRFSRHAFIEIVPGGTELRTFGVHLSAVHAAWTETRRTFELRALLRSIKHSQEGPHVLAGDFNTLAPGELLDVQKLPPRLRPLVWLSGGRIRWRTVQIVMDAGYVDVYRNKHVRQPGWTFPTWDPHVRLDYVFVPEPLVDAVMSCEIVDGSNAVPASDHFPLLTELDVL
jgi:endonuclease/exonuclease/phosphatase family metal-dependent hydrolase